MPRRFGAGAVIVAVLAGMLSAGGGRVAEAAAGETVFLQRFETVGGLPAGWTGSGQVVAGGAGGSAASLRVADASTTGYAMVRSPLIPVAPERHYDLSVFVRTDTPAGNGDLTVLVEQFEILAGTAPGPRIALRWLDPARSGSWREHRLNFTTAGRAASIRVALVPANRGVEHTGRAWFDTVHVTTAVRADDPVLDVHGRPVPVTSVEDAVDPMPPHVFWSLPDPITLDSEVSQRSLWSYPLLRRHFFAVNLAGPRVVAAEHRGMRQLDTTIGVAAPVQDGAVPAQWRRVVAGDIRYHPIASPHPYQTGTYTRVYYPRRTHVYLDHDTEESLLPAMLLTGDSYLTGRARELLSFLLFSQYAGDGGNAFTETYFPAEFRARPDWRGGWDYVYNWRWPDAYGYTWSLHESDHHVGSDIAKVMVRAYETTGSMAYLDAAWRHVYHQVPRYGWHTGIWNGKRYYWTEYNPTGEDNPRLDATDNVQALVARAAAMVGYYYQDPRLLEYARGLLWYALREFTTDGRWYYDGGENPRNQRAATSHDMAVLLPLLHTTAYLLKSGVALDQEMAILGQAYDRYRDLARCTPVSTGPCAPFHRISDGQAAKLPPHWRADSGSWHVTSYFTANRAGTGLVVADRLPTFSPPVAAPDQLELRVSRLRPPVDERDGWAVDPAADRRFRVTPAQLREGVATGLALQPGDAFRISYELAGEPGSWTALPTATVTFESGGQARSVTTTVPDVAYPTVVTDAGFPATAAQLAFPLAPEREARFRD